MTDVNYVRYDFDVFKGFEDIKLLSTNGKIFWYNFKCDVKKQKLFLTVQYIGPQEQACTFTYEFELYAANDDETRITMRNRVLRDTEKLSTVYDVGCVLCWILIC
jgi:hypothetical protein